MLVAEFASKLSATSLALGGVVLYFVLSKIVSSLRLPKYPKNIPWMGNKNSWVEGISNLTKWHQQGYDRYTKSEKAYIIPGILGGHPEIVLPRSQMQWMLDQPDNIFSTSEAHYDVLVGDYNFLENVILKDPYHERVIHRSLARNLNGLIPSLQDELDSGMDVALGMDTQNWKSVTVWDTLLDIIPNVTNRMLVGSPLCKDKDYIDNVKKTNDDVIRNVMIFQIIPSPLHALFGPLLAIPNHYHFRKTVKYTLPLIKQRLHDIERKEAGDPEYKNWTPPNEYLTWHIHVARSDGRLDELTPWRIAQRLMPLNFAAIHTSAMTAFGTILDLLACKDAASAIESLREESTRVFAEEGGQWTKSGLSKLYRIDSIIRESMRLSSFMQTSVQRKVVAPQGVTNPATGDHYEQGTVLSCSGWATLHDEEVFGNALTFDPFRFSRDREEFEARPKEDQDLDEGLKLKKTGLVTTGNSHLGFGHGRHAW